MKPDKYENYGDFSFKSFFTPFTSVKAIFFIIVIGFIVYGNMLFNGFVWDDKTFIQFNPQITNLSLTYLLGENIFNNPNVGQYRSFVALYFGILYSLFGDNTFFYHLIQLIIHIINSVLVLFLLKRFVKLIPAFLLSLVFLVHPIQVESVSYIASAGNPVFTLFGLLALLLAMKKILLWKNILLINVLLLLSLFAKETGVVFLFLVILYRILFYKSYVVTLLLGGCFTLFAYTVFRFGVADIYFAQKSLIPIVQLSFSERVFTIPSVLFYYLKTFIAPVDLAVNQLWIVKMPDTNNFFIPLTAICVMLIFFTVILVHLYKSKNKYLQPFMFFSLWFGSGMFIYSQIFALNMTVADRWFYFPMIGLLGLIAILIQYGGKIKINKYILLIIAICVISLLSARTMIRNANWTDALSLYTHDIQVEANFDNENSLGGELNTVGRTKEALVHFKKSVALFPHETNLFNLGLVYEQQGDLDSAETYYQRALDSKSYGEIPVPHIHQSLTYLRYSVVLMQQSRLDECLSMINRGLKDYPDDPQLWYTKALCEYKKNNKPQALESAQNAYDLLPNNKDTKYLYERLKNNLPVDVKIN